ncbi:MAG: PASTA domain-containing protein [Anaerolineae bacterium]|nr:PASTA domain-containing protein [Anaerolineae bacterium]
MKKWLLMLVLCLLAVAGAPASRAQGSDVTVPDVTGLSLPQAAAQLNRAGLRLGAEINQGWTPDSGQVENSIFAQSIPGGQVVPFGTAVDVTVLRSPNATLLYDDNDLTLVNQTGGELNLTGISFAAVGGAGAQFAATRWAGFLRVGQCVQVWSVGRNGPKGLDECTAIQNWLVTMNPAEHFWTGAGGTTQFTVLQNGVPRATCPVANPGRCAFFLSSGTSGGDSTDYVYFAYTSERLAIINRSEDRWMVLEGYSMINYFAPPGGLLLYPSDASLYGMYPPDVETVSRLAPGQCILYTNSSPESSAPPQPCDVIAQLDIGPTLIFWGADFGVIGSDGQERKCAAATPGRLTLCVMPR